MSDSDGALVANVTVEITNERTRKIERIINSESDGSYSATLLPAGIYSLRIVASNFKQSLIASVAVRSNETSRQDVKLEVGNIAETVEIVAGAITGVNVNNPGSFNCQFSEVGDFTDNQYTITHDRLMRDGKDKLTVRWFWDNSSSSKPYGGSQSTDELNITRNGQGGATIFNFQDDPRQNRAIGDFDRPHRLVVSYSYDLPVPGHTFFRNQFFQGWTIGGIITFQSGLPFSVTDSTSGGAYGNTGGGTATFVCATAEDAYTRGSVSDRLEHYLNPACFARAANVPFAAGAGATGYGNAPRNAWRGPFQQNWDLAVNKQVELWERHRLQFRMEVFNLFNHPIFRFPNVVNIGTPSTFTQITETATPARLIQFGLRYGF